MRRAILLTTAAVSLAAAAGWWFLRGRHPDPRSDPGAPPLLPLSSSPFLNTGPGAAYLGSAACTRCHPGEHSAYQRTGMSRSTAEVNPDKQPPDAVLDHRASSRRFVVERREGQLRHRELLLDGDRADVVLNDFPLKHAIGSGRHARTYTVEVDGFLVESPLTWFASRQRWGMSPGFDHPAHKGFERPIGSHCLFCHVGRFEVESGSKHRYRILETAIGCERCHGPGSLHVARWEQDDPGPAGPGPADLTIVNPRWLPRDRAEAVCQQCHLSGDLVVLARGRKLTDYRPGLPLQDVHLVYRLADAGEGMAVTGHVEQLHRSQCYQRSERLTCTTCHDPHGFPTLARRVAYYRAACLSCHAEGACRVDPRKRQKESPDNSCVQCHMPTGSTDIPHVAFSHHRIGVHSAPEAHQRVLPPVDPSGAREALEPFHDLSRLSTADRKRALGLAYGKAGTHQEIAWAVRPFNRRAEQLLSEAWDAGLRDGPVASTLARTRYWLGLGGVTGYAEAALRDPDLEGEDRCDVLFLLADDQVRRGNYAAAAELLREVTRLRRNAVDWSYLAKCLRALGRDEEALRLLETAAQIGSTIPRLRRELAEAYEQRGDRERAEWHRQRIPKE